MKFFKPLVVVLLALSFGACKKNNAPTYSSTATLNGSKSVPAVTTSATGTITYSFNSPAKTLAYTITYSGLSGNPTNNASTGSGIYGPAAEGANGVLLQSITFPTGTSGSITGTLPIDGYAIKEANLLAGYYYLTIKTAANPGGEIRAQIKF